MSLLGTLMLARAGDLMFAPAISGLKIVGVQTAKLGAAAGLSYLGYRTYEMTRYKTTHSMFLDKHWGDFGLEVEKRGRKIRPKYESEEKVSDYLYKSYYKLPTGMAVEDILEQIPAIELALNAEVDCYREDKYCVMEISTGHLRKEIDFDVNKVLQLKDMILPLSIGESKRGYQAIDLADYPHFLIGGQTGGGKSVFVRQAITSLVHYRRPEELELYMIDLKGGLEFKLFKDVPHVKGIAKNVWETLELLVYMEEEMEYRMKILHDEDPTVEKIATYNELAENKLPYIVLAIDEFAELSPEEVSKKSILKVPEEYRQLASNLDLFDITKVKKGQPATVLEKELLEKTHSITSRLLRLARAVGIHLLIATQRPDAKVLPGQSKQNIPSTVAFKVRNKINSQILLDSDSAAVKIPPGVPGRAIFQIGHLEVEVQVPYLSTKEARDLLAKLNQSPSLYTPEPELESDPFDPIMLDFGLLMEETQKEVG